MRFPAILAIALLSFAGACAKKVEVVETTPVTVEPVDTGTYK